MEHMVAKRLNYVIDTNNMIDHLQCSFRETRSSNDHAVRLEPDIRTGSTRKHCISLLSQTSVEPMIQVPIYR